MIDKATIDRIIDAADVVEVVQEFVSLKRRGTNYLGCCPFHNEKTPSFTVSPSKQIYKCFGCGKGGGSVNFIMEHEHLTYVEALKYLARKYHIEIQDKEETAEEIAIRNRRESLMIVSAYAQEYFSDYLFNTEEGRNIGMGYFRERGFRDDIIRKFQLGFCPDKKRLFTDTAVKKGYKMEFLEETGLSIHRDDWVVDRFAGRVIFPFHNLAGRVVAFGGRVLKKDPNTAKYLNSPESEIYHKSKIVYGIYQAKNAITRADKCFLVEGYTDVLSMHQSGIENVVASSGTSLTTEQIKLIKRFTQNITVLYDGDSAGIKASLRGIDMILEEGINVKVVLLPDGEDPDSFAQKQNSSDLLNFIAENETDFIRFKTKLLLGETENDPIKRASLIHDIVKSISVIPDNIQSAEYAKACSKLLDIDENILYAEIRNIQHKHTDDENRKLMYEVQRKSAVQQVTSVVKTQPVEVIEKKNPCEVEELALLRVLLRYFDKDLFTVENEDKHSSEVIKVGQFITGELQNDGLTSTDPLIKNIFDLFAEHGNEALFNPERYFTHHENPEINSLISGLLLDKHTESKIWSSKGAHIETEQELLYMLVPKLVEEYKLRKVKIMISDLIKEIGNTSNEDINHIMELQKTITNLKMVEKELSEKLGKRAVIQ